MTVAPLPLAAGLMVPEIWIDGGATTGFTVTVAVACLLESARLVTVTWIEVFVSTTGAVRRPLLEIFPALAHQLAAVLAVLLTLAVNCCAPPEETVALPGEREMLTGSLLLCDF